MGDLASSEAEAVRLGTTRFERKDRLAQRDAAVEKLQESERILAEAEERLSEIGYDADAHETVKGELEALTSVPETLAHIRDAEREEAAATSRAEALAAQLATLLPELEARDEHLRGLEPRLEDGDGPGSADLEATLSRVRARRDEGLSSVAALRRDAETFRREISEAPRLKRALAQNEKDALLYGELVTAFGPEGIPALIIEQAIPELEHEANAVLSRLTQHRTQVALESIRDLKSGGTRETLDIRITDDQGERAYELFSGGETFRVDFALRIALSKLLARRAGAPLQTLVIDEGFGTQDADGVERLVDAIQSVREEFEKILIITHVESVKRAFPTTVAVTKSADRGSTFQVLN